MPDSSHIRPTACPLRLTILACAVALTACAQLPERNALPEVKPLAQYAGEKSFAAPLGQWPPADWWTVYGDPQLNALIGEALADSPSVAAAQARFQRAAASVQVADSALQPQVSANASVSTQKQSYNYLTPAGMTPKGWQDYGRATLDFSWELDLWGKNRAALAAATSEADAAKADEALARLSLSASIASSYAELARLHAALDTAKAAFEVRARTAGLFRRRYDNGLETLGGVRQVEARRAAAEADVLSLREQIDLQQNRIAALVGAGPDRGLTIARPAVGLNRPFRLPRQLSDELIGRRPDLMAARLRVDGSAKKIDQARAAFYPSVNVAALIGVLSLGLSKIVDSGSSIGSVGPAISLPIFNGGRLRGQLQGAEAEHAEAVANYDRAVVQALQEVADAAAGQKALGGQIARIGEAVDAAREAWRIQNQRYEGGLSTYLDVLSSEDTLIGNQRALTDLQSRAFTLDVALVRALGGGYITR